MKKSLLCLLLLISVIVVFAQSISITALTAPGTYNSFNMAQIDPDMPYSQPMIFRWNLSKTLPDGITELPFDLKVKLMWDGVSIPLLDYVISAKPNLWSMNTIDFSNRDIFTSIDTDKFYSSDESISLDNLFDAAPALEDVVLNTGLLPDGEYTLTVQATFIGGESNISEVSFWVKNANSIFLNYPGVSLGQSIPQINNNIVVFNWQSNLVGINQFNLTIREYELKDDLVGRDLDTSGRLFLEIENLSSSVYSEFMPFNNEYYYAWKVSTPVTTESAVNAIKIESEYKVFQFSDDGASTTNGFTDRIVELLRKFNNRDVNQLLDNGNIPTTNVVTEDNWLTGEKAIAEIKEFIGKPVKITITEE
ncbi:MAG: hypothetical protein JXR56_04875 [Candidatus Cloacimonetes bacterium]|nr:hypothetical protein [Candidatus Cloacimonadota bacterium]